MLLPTRALELLSGGCTVKRRDVRRVKGLEKKVGSDSFITSSHLRAQRTAGRPHAESRTLSLLPGTRHCRSGFHRLRKRLSGMLESCARAAHQERGALVTSPRQPRLHAHLYLDRDAGECPHLLGVKGLAQSRVRALGHTELRFAVIGRHGIQKKGRDRGLHGFFGQDPYCAAVTMAAFATLTCPVAP